MADSKKVKRKAKQVYTKLTPKQISIFECFLVIIAIPAFGAFTYLNLKIAYSLIDLDHNVENISREIKRVEMKLIVESGLSNFAMNRYLVELMKDTMPHLTPDLDSMYLAYFASPLPSAVKLSEEYWGLDSAYAVYQSKQEDFHLESRSFTFVSLITLLWLIFISAVIYDLSLSLRTPPRRRSAFLGRNLVKALETSLSNSIGFGSVSMAKMPLSIRVMFLWERLISFVHIILILGILISRLA